MLRKVIFVCCGTLLACAAAGTAWATTYSFVQLASLGADLRDYAFGVNAIGGVPEVVGKSGPHLGDHLYRAPRLSGTAPEREPASSPISPRVPSRR